MIKFYKPNPKVTGSACSFTYSAKDECIYVNFIKQSGWNDSTKRGSFSGNHQDPLKSCSLKLNQTEMGEIISAIKRNSEFMGYHDSPNQVTRIKFCPYFRADRNNPEDNTQRGFSFSISKESRNDSANKASFIIGFTFAESVVIEAFFSYVLVKTFEAAAKQQETWQKSTKQTSPKQEAPDNQAPPPKKPSPEESALDDCEW